MELTINIDEKEFTKLLEGELKNFSEQELHNICREALIKQMSNPEIFSYLFVEKENKYYGYTDGKLVANDLLKSAAKNVNLDPLFKDFQNQVIEYLKENHDKIISQLLVDIFVNGLGQYLYNSNFMNDIRNSFSSYININKN